MKRDVDKISDAQDHKPVIQKERIICDISFAALCIGLATYYFLSVSSFQLPSWDGASFLANARAWLNGTPLPETFRPPLLSWLISGVWMVTGEDWTIVKYLPAFFTVGSGVLLYLTLRKHKRGMFSLSVASLTMLNPLVLYWGAQIMSESVSLFFLALSLYLLKGRKSNWWFLAGVAIGMTFASRYPIILPALAIFAAEAIARKDMKFAIRTLLGILPAVMLVIFVVYLKTGSLDFAMAQDTHFGLPLSAYYLNRWADIWGWSIIFIPVAFLFKSTFTDRYNYAFIAWFAITLAFWSANVANHQDRFAIQMLTPAYFIAFIGIENVTKIIVRGIMYIEKVLT